MFGYKSGVFLAWLVALTATAGSLYFSEIVGYTPCKLCWIQRIFMYPLVYLIPFGLLMGVKQMRSLIFVTALPGLILAVYHYLLQWGFWGTNTCNQLACDTRYVNYFSFVTIPFLSMTAFALLVFLVFSTRRAKSSF